MRIAIRLFLVVCALPALAFSSAAEPQSDAKTVLSQRGKLLFADDFDRPPAEPWRTGKGKWEIVDGALKSAELPAEGHAASARRPLSCHDVVIQCSIKLDGARHALIKLNGTKGHCCQLMLAPDALILQKHVGPNGEPQWTDIERRATAIPPGVWHTLVLEIRGTEVVGSLDDAIVTVGRHDSLDVEKTTLILNVAGDSASFNNLRIWEALPNANGEATKAKRTPAAATN